MAIKIESAIAIIALVATLSASPARAFSAPAPRQQKAGARSLPVTAPERVGMSGPRLARIDEAVLDSIKRGQTPGAVVLVGRKGHVVYRKAFGDRAVVPRREPMTEDTIFDLASLTKVAATATSVMILVERGKLSLADPVALFIPEFGRFGKERVTVEQLLTHRSGLVPDNDISDYVGVSVDPLEKIYELRLAYEPGSRFVYSDVGYIVAAEIVRRVSGLRLDRFAGENIFTPLGMRETRWGSGHAPTPWPREALARTAPTETREGRSMRGEVHDSRAYEMGGVAGHAGLFSTADDLAIFCQMFLNRGEYAGARLLAPYTVERMLSAHSLPASQMRGIGWDVNTSFSSNRGDLFPVGTFGHTGFTGTSVWIDPQSRAFVVLLTNRVHPDGKGDVSRLRSLIASIVAGAISDASTAPLLDFAPAPMQAEPPRAALNRGVPSGPLHPVLTGLDVLERDDLRQLEGRKVALITNHTGRTRAGRSAIDVLASARNLKLVSIITPEHGLRGTEDAPIEEAGRDEKTGLPVYSIYARNRRRPTPEMLRGADTVVFDIQDIGARFYTYITTCAYAMEEAARNKMKFVVLDRPNPIDGYSIEGPLADAELVSDPAFSFTTAHALPVRHGLTVGEFAGLYNSERKVGADLTVIKMEGWRRADYFDGTGLAWVNPSPNMRSLTQALLYPGVGLLETTNLSVGRGTDTPFEVVGAPWIDGTKLGEALNRAGLAGVRFVPVRFTPRQSKFAGEACGGVNIIITDRNSFRPVATGIEIAYHLYQLYAGSWKVDDYIRLLANRAALSALKAGKSPQEITATWQGGLADFARVRRKYLLY
ncbi:MAG TPA: exo-beta-N-acetylmuramidase NamZ domain-containing protein [Blastocatellia bacterium]|nr:exo-beta-N-acetylmuramidase NamZ domain-containing protein [Blastocatellia bacterium]